MTTTSPPSGHDTRSLEECTAALERYLSTSKVPKTSYSFPDLSDKDKHEVSFIYWLLKVLGKLPQQVPVTAPEETYLFESLNKVHDKIWTYFCETGPRVLKMGVLHMYWLIQNWDSEAEGTREIRAQLEKFATIGDLTQITCTHRLLIGSDIQGQRSDSIRHVRCLRAITSTESKSVLDLNLEVDRKLELWILENFILRGGIRNGIGNPTEVAKMIKLDSMYARQSPVSNYIADRRPSLTGPDIMQQMYHLVSNWKVIHDEKLRGALERVGVTDAASFALFIHENYFCYPSPLEPKDGVDANVQEMQKHVKCWLEDRDRSQLNECDHGFSCS